MEREISAELGDMTEQFSFLNMRLNPSRYSKIEYLELARFDSVSKFQQKSWPQITQDHKKTSNKDN